MLPRTHEKIEYKYVVTHSDFKNALWEEGENRILELHRGNSSKKEILNRKLTIFGGLFL